MTNSVDPDQTAPIGAVRSWSTLFASILKFVSNVRQLFAADDFGRRHFSDAFFLGALRIIFLLVSNLHIFVTGRTTWVETAHSQVYVINWRGSRRWGCCGPNARSGREGSGQPRHGSTEGRSSGRYDCYENGGMVFIALHSFCNMIQCKPVMSWIQSLEFHTVCF